MKSKKALLIIDMLNDFVEPRAPLEVPEAQNIVSNIQDRIKKARRQKIPVVYVCDAHAPNDPEFRVWPRHAVRGTRGAQVVSELKPQKKDFMVPKVTYSSFFKTKLDGLLKKLKPKELILTGVCTEICVLYTAVDALARGYAIEVPSDCVAGLTPEGHEFALKQMQEVLKPYQK